MTTGILEGAVMAFAKLNNNRDRIRALYEAMSREEMAADLGSAVRHD
jgi:hypothetical protein